MLVRGDSRNLACARRSGGSIERMTSRSELSLALAGAGAGALLLALALDTDAGPPAAAGAGVALLAAARAYRQVPEDKSHNAQMPLILPLALVASATGGLFAGLPLLSLPDAVGVTSGAIMVALVALPVGWVIGGLLPRSGWHRAGRPWRGNS